MASSWTDLAKQMTDMYTGTTNLKKMADNFRKRHGKKGEGEDTDTVPYKFGRFAERMKKLNDIDDVFSDKQRAQFMIDAGTRRWEARSLKDIETVVKHSMTRNDSSGHSDPKEISFEIVAGDMTVPKAKAEIYDADKNTVAPRDTNGDVDVGRVNKFHIKITCPPDTN
jgi:hypothetical protein